MLWDQTCQSESVQHFDLQWDLQLKPLQTFRGAEQHCKTPVDSSYRRAGCWKFKPEML